MEGAEPAASSPVNAGEGCACRRRDDQYVTHRRQWSERAATSRSGISEELITVLARVRKLSRSINPEILQQLQSSTRQTIAQYETIDPAKFVPALQKQRVWLDELIDECGHPRQRG
ncbi:hypothetical protein [Nocardia abscessus]|uniref:hypothetical protein n=1 Tax=Nocardia abscessus TaxID=120957 RepID=UPI00245712BD|nr:hypothetical protein [Nocardia abscessus]